MIVVDMVLAIPLAVVGLCFVYLCGIATKGLRVSPSLGDCYDSRFLVLIPVYNEQGGLGGLIDSLRRLEYPKERIKVIFIADHCTDNTAGELRAAGFEVIERQSGPPGKGAALEEGMRLTQSYLEDDHDAVAIFDADNVIASDFLSKIACRIRNGARIVQGNTGIVNKDESLFTKLNYLNFAVTNRFKEYARSQWNLTCRLRGHGMAFCKEIVEGMKWRRGSLVEDQELLVSLVLAGQRVAWEHHAHVWSVLPPSTAEAVGQRRRWAGGKNAFVGRAARSLFRKLHRNHNPIAFDLLVDVVMPSYAILLALILIGLVCSVVLVGNGLLSLGYSALGTMFLGYYLVACLLEGVPLTTFAWFITSPAYILWRFWISISSVRAPSRWR